MDAKRARELIDFLKPSGDVLQIFWGSEGLSKELQRLNLKSYTLIDPDLSSLDHGKLVRSHWKEALTLLPSFDWIFFNKELPAPCISRPEAMQAEGIVQHGKALIGELAQMLPELDQIRYSDGDLDAFCSELPPSEKKYLPRFLNQLLASGQITQEQYQKVLASQGVEAPPAKSLEDSLLFDLLTTCLERSLNANGCFIALLAKSNYEDPRFFEKVITDPFIDYSEEKIPSSDQEFLVMKAIKR